MIANTKRHLLNKPYPSQKILILIFLDFGFFLWNELGQILGRNILWSRIWVIIKSSFSVEILKRFWLKLENVGG